MHTSVKRWIKADVGELESVLDGLLLVRAQMDTAAIRAERHDDTILRYQIRGAIARLENVTRGVRKVAVQGQIGPADLDPHHRVEQRP